ERQDVLFSPLRSLMLTKRPQASDRGLHYYSALRLMPQQGRRMPNKVRWGVLSTAHFALTKAIPAMQKGEWSEVAAIASRDKSKAEKSAKELGIARAYGSYEELLADPQIEAIYNPLPNHMHVPWSVKAAEAGKHVLCEKPLSMSVAEAQQLIAARDRTGVKIGEAFMVRTHPQWLHTRELISSGRIGELRSIVGVFSYFNRDPKNIRNILEIEIPFNAPNDRPCRIFIDDGGNLFGENVSVQSVSTCDQYTVQGDIFSRAIRENGEVPVPLEDATKNMAVIEAIFRSAESGK